MRRPAPGSYLARIAPHGSCGSLVCGAHPAGGARGSRNHGPSDRGSGGGEAPRHRDSRESSAPPAGAEVVWAGAGRERGRGPGANSGLEEGGAQAETAGGGGAKTGAERKRGGIKIKLGQRDPGRNRTLKAESPVERRGLDNTGAKMGGACSKGRGQCEGLERVGAVPGAGGGQFLAKAGPG